MHYLFAVHYLFNALGNIIIIIIIKTKCSKSTTLGSVPMKVKKHGMDLMQSQSVSTLCNKFPFKAIVHNNIYFIDLMLVALRFPQTWL